MYLLEKSIKNIINYSFLKSTSNIVNVGYGIDNNYVRCCATSIISFYENNPKQNFHFHILASDFTKESINKFKILAQQYNINISIYIVDSNYFYKLPTKSVFPIPTYFRFLLPILNKNLSKIIYVDADIICLNNIEELLSFNLDNNIIAAVPDSETMNQNRNNALNLKSHIYFNAGMLLVNVKEWNKYNVTNKLIETVLNTVYKLDFLDQDALNLILTQKVVYLPKKFNYFNNGKVTDKEIKDIVLLHFTASPKPWYMGWEISPLSNDYNRDLYKIYENKTPWRNSSPVISRKVYHLLTYSKNLYHNGYYLKSIKYFILALLVKLKSMI